MLIFLWENVPAAHSWGLIVKLIVQVTPREEDLLGYNKSLKREEDLEIIQHGMYLD